ncbi:MAG TPA: nitroreductase family protein [Clostridia bacterium]|nr:nitroreductase family protein [Clostridia bacterium]
MDFSECVATRRSVRHFKGQPVARELVERIVAAAAFAPSWKNAQSARYIAVLDEALRGRIARECVMGYERNRVIIEGAPLLIVMTYVAGRSGFERDGGFSTSKGAHWESFDAGIAAQTFCLSAWNEGLGSVILGIFDEQKVIEAVGVPAGQKVAALIALGYPDETPPMPRRKDAHEILTFI